MTPSDKAKELYKKYFNAVSQKEYIEKIEGLNFCNWNKKLHIQEAKQCALICVDKIVNAIEGLEATYGYNYNISYLFWNEVKQEINKL